MLTFYREAGWPIHFVLLLGAISLWLAVRYARAPRRENFPLIVGFTVATVLVGVLGTVLGVQISANAIAEVQAPERWIFLIGLKESLNNMVAALMIAAIDTMLVTAGAHRLARTAAALAPATTHA